MGNNLSLVNVNTGKTVNIFTRWETEKLLQYVHRGHS